jgi:hypothetical protein
MYFCGQHVKANYIIGMGMLEQEQHPDERVYIAMLRVRYRFTLYLRHYSQMVYSDWVDLKGDPVDVAKANEMVKAFKQEHSSAIAVLRLRLDN